MSIVVKIEQVKSEIGKVLVSEQIYLKDELTIGRAPKNDILLSSPDVSGHHAKLECKLENGRKVLSIVDLNSSNGTYIEESRIASNKLIEVLPNQRILIGSFLLLAKCQLEEQQTQQHSIEDITKAPAEDVSSSLSKSVSKETISSLSVSKKVPEVKEELVSKRDPRKFEEEEQFRRAIHQRLIDRLDLRRKDIVQLSESDLRDKARVVVEQIISDLRWEIPEGMQRESLIKQVLDEALGLGALEQLIEDEDCSEIMLNSYSQIYAERHGKLAITDLRFSSEQAVLGAIERILAPIGRRIDESSPMVDARLKDGSRVNAVIRPLALNGPCITIRKFSKVPLTIDDLVRGQSLSEGMAEFLSLAVSNRLNIVISGGTGSGKTTLLNIIASFIPEGERVITVEDAAELRLPREHIVSFETRPPNLEGKGAVTIRDLVRNALRMRPDRIIVGECRGAEALDMLQAMNTGHDGSMTTGHANTPSDMVRRLETMVLTSGLDLPVRAVREQIASAIHLIVQQTRFGCGTRKITSVSEIVGMDYDEGTVMLEDIFLFQQEGYGEDGKIKGYHQATGYVPKFFRKLSQRGLSVNADVFSPGRG